VTGLLVDAVLSRRYRIVIDDDPVMIVSEWFLGTVPIALSAHLRAPVTPEAEG
jgi:chorismate-pyruvate lyase